MPFPVREYDRVQLEKELRREIAGSGVLDASTALRGLRRVLPAIDARLVFDEAAKAYRSAFTGEIIVPMQDGEVMSLVEATMVEFAHLVDEVKNAV